MPLNLIVSACRPLVFQKPIYTINLSFSLQNQILSKKNNDA